VTLLDHVERSSSADEKPKRILAGDELRRLLAAIDPDHRLIFETAAETGAPLAETLGIVWREVDLDAETITFSHQLDSHGARIPLKTKRSRRTIGVTPSLIAKLREHKLAGGPHDLVFVTRVGTPHDHRNVGGRVMARAVKRAGLQAVSDEIPAPTFHPLRHSHSSALIAHGWDPVEVSARLGHASVSSTLMIYAHEFDAARRSQDRDRLASLYGRPDGSTMAASNGNGPQPNADPSSAEVIDFQRIRDARQ
jgi:integrase